MKNIVVALLVIGYLPCSGQRKTLRSIEHTVIATEVAAHLSFLASDEMRGRNTGSPELDIAANYIATQFKLFGIKAPTGTTGYYQAVDLQKTLRPTVAEFVLGSSSFTFGNDILVVNGPGIDMEKEIVFVGFGSKDDFDKTVVKDRIAVTYAGREGGTEAGKALLAISLAKQSLAASHGAVALVEVLNIPGGAWQGLIGSLSGGRISIKASSMNTIPHLWMKHSENADLARLIESKHATGKISLTVRPPVSISAKNVIGVIEGTDAKLRHEWIVVSAHYDHVGVRKGEGQDSIYNGARDNAIGTVAVLEAAKYFGIHPPNRSIMLIALTAEEVGLLGSAWYAEHPIVPLNQTVFNLNCDGAGYNDTTIATIIDLNRTTADGLLREACKSQGLELKGDPAPEQGLFDRSDNVNFARKGVPSVNISPGVKAFDQEMFKYYHQPADEVGTLDMAYLERFYRTFVYAIYLLTTDAPRPMWTSGDKYEEAGKKLYGR